MTIKNKRYSIFLSVNSFNSKSTFLLGAVIEDLDAMAFLPFLSVHINLGQVQLLMPCSVPGNWSIHCAEELL